MPSFSVPKPSTAESRIAPSSASVDHMTSDHLPLTITVAYSPEAGKVLETTLHLPGACTIAQALPLAHQALLQAALETGLKLDEAQLAQCPPGVWGRRQPVDHELANGDRLELYRPLLVDPKLARRQRFASQGARRAGLFAKRRPGGKAGY